MDPDGLAGSQRDGTHNARGPAEASARERAPERPLAMGNSADAATRRLRPRPPRRTRARVANTSVLAFDSLELSSGRAAAGWEERIVEKVIGYVRVSTEEQGRSGLGLEAQRATIARMADAHDWDVTWVEDAGASGKSLNRPGLQAALTALKAGQADALVVAKLDRLSRSVHDFAGLLLVARREGWALNALDMGVDTTTSAGTMVAHVMIAVAEWERAVIGDRTSAALQAAQARGVKLGRPRSVSKEVEMRVFELRAAGLSYARVAEQLNVEAVPTAHGGRAWHASTVSRILNRKANNRSAVLA